MKCDSLLIVLDIGNKLFKTNWYDLINYVISWAQTALFNYQTIQIDKDINYLGYIFLFDKKKKKSTDCDV